MGAVMHKKFIIIPFILLGTLYAQSASKKEMLKYFKPPVKESTPDSIKKKKFTLPPLADSIKLYGPKDIERTDIKIDSARDIKFTMPMVRPDPNIKYNMPMVTPDPGRTYSMPVLPVPYNSDYHVKILSDKEKAKLKTKPLNKK
jgi:hypothetical protein